MNTTFKKTGYPLVLLASLPLLILGGCASQNTTKEMEGTAPSATEPQKPLAEIQDPIAMLNTPATEMANENAVPNSARAEDEQAVSISNGESVLFPPAIKPQEQRIGFGFNQTAIDHRYHKLLKQHAEYLAENKDLTLKINGHTDSYGPKQYNQQLSKQRAEAVAKLLVEYGAPQDRIIVSGVADNEPLSEATHRREHRRVELDYQDHRLVSVD